MRNKGIAIEDRPRLTQWQTCQAGERIGIPSQFTPPLSKLIRKGTSVEIGRTRGISSTENERLLIKVHKSSAHLLARDLNHSLERRIHFQD